MPSPPEGCNAIGETRGKERLISFPLVQNVQKPFTKIGLDTTFFRLVLVSPRKKCPVVHRGSSPGPNRPRPCLRRRGVPRLPDLPPPLWTGVCGLGRLLGRHVFSRGVGVCRGSRAESGAGSDTRPLRTEREKKDVIGPEMVNDPRKSYK